MAANKEIISNLIKSYWMEIETVINYISNSVNLDGVRAEEIKKSLSVDILEEIAHAQSLAKRIKELGGSVPGSMELKAEQKYLQTLKDTTDVVSVIEGVIQAEDGAVKQYNKLIKLCEGKDYVTQDLCIRLLGMEESHRIEFKGFLKEYKK
ncbi:MAG: rubrerythrin [Ignavibacteria bacterium RIFOXYB2_FULL_35_12]|nr:MAG: rubrerythrin [Ignavibacteria bacterium GWA2_36_19]OGU50698.1 MAG: rubrerythrin [Ignavibacteria bacterium GWC2_35_8]OGU61839.1 MAG: rubrerythrin [Ignavibacteria bacterium GWF2_35_20]OGU82676.1 MAG: rubrerythrin [Ignavibacteria bacterium RIFOXYA2_FULL_35_9]OGU88249.1 MAG: rubrerythrin [Ignavibacteria bacterium RIFOXYA12_FULL_35_25]OGU91263.1 MAG: rubrerythrin [Ignavibacteria bacterium RIFOXYC12_FULL_35_11]OGU93205.1 MAG: rubrerythrin [Ignavibacteria bacterium RIFOXYB12_FULL_35_14]OGU99